MRKYLTSAELIQIVKELTKRKKNGELVHNSAVERYILQVGMVAQVVLEDMGKFKDCNEIYDYVVENKIDFDVEIENYYIINSLVAEELSIDNTIKDFVKNMEKSLKDMPDTVKLEETLTKFREEIK